MHPKFAVVFARWLSVDFAIWCDEQIDGIIHGTPEQTDWKQVRHEAAATYKVMSSMLDMKRQLEGKDHVAPLRQRGQAGELGADRRV